MTYDEALKRAKRFVRRVDAATTEIGRELSGFLLLAVIGGNGLSLPDKGVAGFVAGHGQRANVLHRGSCLTLDTLDITIAVSKVSRLYRFHIAARLRRTCRRGWLATRGPTPLVELAR